MKKLMIIFAIVIGGLTWSFAPIAASFKMTKTQNDQKMRKEAENLVGKKINRLTVLSLNSITKNNMRIWNCVCECGTYKVVYGNNLKSGNTKSCGCYNSDRAKTTLKEQNTKHGYSIERGKEYVAWEGLRQRCNNKKLKHYEDYGGRGITYCEEWNDFNVFLKDMGKAPKGYSLDRINNNGNYCKENCRWANNSTQNTNRRTTKFITYNGETLSQTQWSLKLGGNRNLVYQRLKDGYSEVDAITKEVIHG